MPTDASIISQMPSLKRKGEKFFNLLERDATELEALVYDEAAKTAFRNALDAVENLTWDETLEAFKMALTADKVAARATLERRLRTIFNMATNYFGIHSAKYRAFEPSDSTRQRDADLAAPIK